MARIPAPDFKLITEEKLYEILERKPELREQRFEGCCTLSQTRLLFGPGAREEDRCLSCLPQDHFVMMPLEYVEEPKHVEDLRITGSIASIRSFIKRSAPSRIA